MHVMRPMLTAEVTLWPPVISIKNQGYRVFGRTETGPARYWPATLSTDVDLGWANNREKADLLGAAWDKLSDWEKAERLAKSREKPA